jgi:hypothetical protein
LGVGLGVGVGVGMGVGGGVGGGLPWQSLLVSGTSTEAVLYFLHLAVAPAGQGQEKTLWSGSCGSSVMMKQSVTDGGSGGSGPVR